MSDPVTCASGHVAHQEGCLDCVELAMKHDVALKEAQRKAAETAGDAEKRLGKDLEREKRIVDTAITCVAGALHVAVKSLSEAHKELSNEKFDVAIVRQHMESAKMATEIAQTLDRLADKVLAR